MEILTHLAAAYFGVGVYWAVTVAGDRVGLGGVLSALLFWPFVIRSRAEDWTDEA